MRSVGSNVGSFRPVIHSKKAVNQTKKLRNSFNPDASRIVETLLEHGREPVQENEDNGNIDIWKIL